MKNQNSLIVKNTIAIYFKTIISVLVTLVSTRIVLNQLGVDDYGIFSVIAGLISLFGILNNSMLVAVQRFISFEIPMGNTNEISKIYNTSICIHLVIAIFILILSETIGLYFVKNFMYFPNGKLDDALIVYQCVIISFIVNVISVPQQAILIAYEKIIISSVVGIIDTLLKLIMAFALILIVDYKLIYYSIFFVVISIIIRILYTILIRIKVRDVHFSFDFDKITYKKLISFSGWNLFGATANMAKIQGVNVILNMFFGTFVNAAYGIANQINSQLLVFSSSIFQSSNSQIIQSYRINDIDRLNFLVYKSTKFAFILFFTISLPVLVMTNDLLMLWLGKIPLYTSYFVKLMIINSYIELFSTPLMFLIQATGKIKNYFIVISSVMILILPISYFLLKIGFPPQIVLFVTIGINLILLSIRLEFVRRSTRINIKNFSINVIVKSFIIICISYMLIITININSIYIQIICVCLISPIIVGALSYFILLSRFERETIKSYAAKKISKIRFFE